MTLKLPGCFAMTETGHGSDVQSVRTTATYDAATGEFVIDTPDDDARKDYIGNAARHGRLAVVFAQLVVAGASSRRPCRRWCRSATMHGRPRPRRTDRGRRAEGGPQRRRQRPARLRPTSGFRARACSTATAASARTARTRARSRTPTGGSSRWSARWCRAGSASPARPSAAAKSALDDRGPLRRAPAAVQGTGQLTGDPDPGLPRPSARAAAGTGDDVRHAASRRPSLVAELRAQLHRPGRRRAGPPASSRPTPPR